MQNSATNNTHRSRCTPQKTRRYRSFPRLRTIALCKNNRECVVDLTKLTWNELASLILDVWFEMKRRNPIGINMYGGALHGAYAAVKEIADEHLVRLFHWDH